MKIKCGKNSSEVFTKNITISYKRVTGNQQTNLI